jgi:diguanylate cyclase (GGDEF)-like protein
MLLDMSGLSRPWIRRVEDAIFLFILLGFQAVYFFCAEFVQIMAFNAYSVFLILVLPGVTFIAGSRRSPLRVLVGVLYVSSFVVSLLRGSEFTDLSGIPRFLGELMNDISLLLFTLVMHVGSAGVLLLMKEESDKRIVEMAFRDSLTSLNNRRYFMENARSLLAVHARTQTAISLLFMDIDHFKGVNDAYGHHFGDDVLRDFSSVIKIAARTSDVSCRYGGEEFLLLLPETGREGAISLAERIRALAAESRFRSKPLFRYSVSIGVACRVPESATVDELDRVISDADAALYRAKEGGRNRVEAL